MRSKTLWETWFETKHPETMVLPVNFSKLFGLNSKPLCYYSIKCFLSGELNISQKHAVIKLIQKTNRQKIDRKLEANSYTYH